jgi:hypothetical protein
VDDLTSLQDPVEKEHGKLVLRIPLETRGAEFVECSRGISEIQDNQLKVTIPERLAGMLRIDEGNLVSVDNANGKFNTTRLTQSQFNRKLVRLKLY